MIYVPTYTLITTESKLFKMKSCIMFHYALKHNTTNYKNILGIQLPKSCKLQPNIYNWYRYSKPATGMEKKIYKNAYLWSVNKSDTPQYTRIGYTCNHNSDGFLSSTYFTLDWKNHDYIISRPFCSYYILAFDFDSSTHIIIDVHPAKYTRSLEEKKKKKEKRKDPTW